VPRILLVKTSSLGDVISNLPVASDILAAYPNATIDWVVEESFAAIPTLHPGVSQVIPVAVRRWRRALFKAATWREIKKARQQLQLAPYDYVIDTQGLIKSALIVAWARGTKCGYDAQSIREPLAARAYDQRFAVSWQWQAVARNRQLAALALGYEIDAQGWPDYGLRIAPRALPWLPKPPYYVLLTATSRAEKLWPAERWIALGQALAVAGIRSVLPGGTPAERQAAQAIAAKITDAVTAPPLGVDALAGVLAGATAVVGVDTGLTHLAAAVGVPVVGLYCGSDPKANGVIAATARNLGAPGAAPTVEEVLAALETLQ
jgi:heptosyltransferase-1